VPTRADIMRDNTGWYKEGLSHKQLVTEFRAYITHVQALDQEYQGHLPPEQRSILSPEAAIRRKLDWEASSPEPGKWEYYEPLRNAWDVLTYERYPVGSDYERLAGNSVFGHYQSRLSEKAPNPEVIRLTNPVQVRMINALTEAADIPHEPGQTEVVIPEKLRHFTKWSMSDEYLNKVKAEAARKRGETPTPIIEFNKQVRQHKLVVGKADKTVRKMLSMQGFGIMSLSAQAKFHQAKILHTILVRSSVNLKI
jgi:hypothetical protein